MWMLALIIACSAGDEVCTYRANVAITETQAQCQRLGHMIGGGALISSYGDFGAAEVRVTCKPVVRVAAGAKTPA